MNIKILYFGVLAEIAGKSNELLEWDEGQNTDDVRKVLFEKYPALREKKFKLAVNQQIINGLTEVPTSADVALLPPFAGG